MDNKLNTNQQCVLAEKWVRHILGYISNNIVSCSWEIFILLYLTHWRLHQEPYYVQLWGLQTRKMLRDWSKSRGDHQGGQGAEAHHGQREDERAGFIQCSVGNGSGDKGEKDRDQSKSLLEGAQHNGKKAT